MAGFKIGIENGMIIFTSAAVVASLILFLVQLWHISGYCATLVYVYQSGAKFRNQVYGRLVMEW